MKKSTIALLLAITMCMTMLLSACQAKTETTSASTSLKTDTTAKAKTPSELTVAVNTTFATLDPALMSTTAMSNVYFNTGATLFRSQADGSMEKELCEDYSVSQDGLVYTIKIKKGIMWSDGQELKAEHFVYGIKRVIGYGAQNAYAARNLTSLVVGAKEAADKKADTKDMENVGVKALNDYTFTITLKTTCPYFHKLLAGNTMTALRPDFAPEHESAWSVNGTYPCLGAMKMVSINPEQEAVFVKNEKYWNAENVKLDKLTVLVMTDMSAQLNAFKAGQLDIALSVPSDTAANKQYEKNFYKAEKYTSNYFVCINTGAKNTVPALKQANVRKALGLAINKPTMLSVLGGGDYNIQLDGFIPYGFTGVKDDFRSEKSYLQYNLEEAKKLMTEAGFSETNKLKFEYLYSNNQFHADVAQMLQQMWSQIYVDVTLKSVEGGVFYDFVDNGEFTTCRYANADSTDPLNFFKIFTSDAQIDGCQAIADKKYDELVAQAYTITDPVKYAEKLHEIEDYMVGEMAYVLPLFTQIPVILKQENIKGFWTTAGGTTYFAGVEKQ